LTVTTTALEGAGKRLFDHGGHSEHGEKQKRDFSPC
jgi:hypothetical protein